jgi:hypothetical protein
MIDQEFPDERYSTARRYLERIAGRISWQQARRR